MAGVLQNLMTHPIFYMIGIQACAGSHGERLCKLHVLKLDEDHISSLYAMAALVALLEQNTHLRRPSSQGLNQDCICWCGLAHIMHH